MPSTVGAANPEPVLTTYVPISEDEIQAALTAMQSEARIAVLALCNPATVVALQSGRVAAPVEK